MDQFIHSEITRKEANNKKRSKRIRRLMETTVVIPRLITTQKIKRDREVIDELHEIRSIQDENQKKEMLKEYIELNLKKYEGRKKRNARQSKAAAGGCAVVGISSAAIGLGITSPIVLVPNSVMGSSILPMKKQTEKYREKFKQLNDVSFQLGYGNLGGKFSKKAIPKNFEEQMNSKIDERDEQIRHLESRIRRLNHGDINRSQSSDGIGKGSTSPAMNQVQKSFHRSLTW
jgi:hypothetical protein